MKRWLVTAFLLVLCCCQTQGGGTCCASVAWCGGWVPGCWCVSNLCGEVGAP